MSKLVSLAAFLFTVFGFSTSASALTLFLLEEGAGGTQKLYKLETDPLGAPTLIGSISSSDYLDVVELVTVSSDRLYALERAGPDPSRPARLLVIDANDASVISAVEIPSFNRGVRGRGFDLSPDGVLYGIFPDGSGNLELRTIDPATGATTFVSRLTSGNFVEALAFAPDGTLYAAAFPPGNLFTIDIPTGVMTQVGASIGEVDTLAYASDDFLYGAQSGPGRRELFRIDPATAAGTVVGDTQVNSIVGVDEVFVEAKPVCDIQLNQSTYTAGDTVRVDVLRLANQSSDPVLIELKIWLGTPESDPASLVNAGADGSFSLPTGFDQDFGPFDLLPPGSPPGSYEFSCRMLDPVTGELLVEDLNPFEIQ